MNEETLKDMGLGDELVAAVMAEAEKGEEALRAELSQAKSALAASEKKAALRRALGVHSPHDADTIIQLMDLSAVELNERGELSGHEEQLQAMKAGRPFLFHKAAPERGGAETRTARTGGRNINDILRGGY